MVETCKSCGTVFEVDEKMLTNNIQWFKCKVCHESGFLITRKKVKTKTN